MAAVTRMYRVVPYQIDTVFFVLNIRLAWTKVNVYGEWQIKYSGFDNVLDVFKDRRRRVSPMYWRTIARGPPVPYEGKIVTPIFGLRDTHGTVNVWAVILDMMGMYHCSVDTRLKSHDTRLLQTYHACIVTLFTQSLTQ